MTSPGGMPGRWDFTTPGNIWKIVPADGRLIVGEERDLAKKSVSFFCVALDDGRARWREKKMSETWWTGIETVHRGVLLIHEYPVPSMPDHRKIVAIDAATGTTLWENAELAFGFASGHSIYASKELFDRRAFYELDLLTGAVAGEVGGDAVRNLHAAAGQGWGLDVQVPEAIAETPQAVRSAFPAGTTLEPGEALRYGDIEISNWYEVRPGPQAGRVLREHLLVIDVPAGTVIHRDVVCDGLTLPAGSTFFRVEERILYVKDRTTLRSFSLPSGGAA